MVTRTECLTSMPVDRDTLNVLRKQAAEARAVIDELARPYGSGPDPMQLQRRDHFRPAATCFDVQ